MYWGIKTTIMTTFSIAPIVLMVFLSFIKSLGIFEAFRRLASRLLRPGKIPVKNFFLGVCVCLERRLMILWTANIYFSDSRLKVESGFSLHGDSFFDRLLVDVFLATILIGLGMDKGP